MRKTIYQQPKLKTAKITASIGFAQSQILSDGNKNSNIGIGNNIIGSAGEGWE